MSHKAAPNDPYQLVTNIILEHLERGVVPWRCPWQRQIGRPRNFSTGREYRGVNVLLLGMLGFASPWWMTFRQIKERGGSVRKGEHSAIIMKYGRQERAVRSGDGTEEMKTLYFLKSYRVFNACQTEGIDFPASDLEVETDPAKRIQQAENITANMPDRPKIKEGKTVRASYRPSTDTVSIPSLARFQTPENYYLTLFHELTHATGHARRLNRKGVTESTGFGGEEYSHEELVAEMGSAFLGMESGIVRDQHEQSAAYLKCWLDALRDPDHRRWIVQAANQAGRAADFILNRQFPEAETSVESQPSAEEATAGFQAA